jgi:hypothetical protein
VGEIKLIVDDSEQRDYLAAIIAMLTDVLDRLIRVEDLMSDQRDAVGRLEQAFADAKSRIDGDVAHLMDSLRQMAETAVEDTATISRLRADALETAQRIEALTAQLAGVDPDPAFPEAPTPPETGGETPTDPGGPSTQPEPGGPVDGLPAPPDGTDGGGGDGTPPVDPNAPRPDNTLPGDLPPDQPQVDPSTGEPAVPTQLPAPGTIPTEGNL